MRRSTKFTKRLAVCIAVVGVVSAFGAASASAAQWSTGYPIKLTGSLTFERSQGGGPVVCQLNATRTAAGFGYLPITCPATGPINLWANVNPVGSSGNYGVHVWPTGSYRSPWGDYSWLPAIMAGPFTSGSAATPSRFTLDDTAFGSIGSAAVTVSGAVNVTTPTGGLVTIVN